ncbi:hypothetical protein GL50803_0014901 [Giardia duodenalis]|uniref:Uncharacterized protein n=1 Tax=Giardia intestinalis (strain ATCC 50803 / WB clone C6) TaxID=184922 RepID=D3KHB4_GIAIC|nr:hypothetical protein GL50803_0014901 [Giardia intestinalis]KAE8305662.1 hypothetical protein GL50803_0014901 [Giardia intestinalis]
MSSQDSSTDCSTDEVDGPYVSTIQFAIQDMAHRYAPKFTKVHTLDTPIPTSQIHVHELLSGNIYMPIQNLPPPCDDPTSPWFYINDCRPQYPSQPYYSVVPQLIIRGTPYYPLNSLTPNKHHVRNSARDLAEFYMDKEDVYGIATALLAKLYMSAISQARAVRDTIHATTAEIRASKIHLAAPTDFGFPASESDCFSSQCHELTKQLQTRFVGLKPYADLSIAQGIKDPLYLLDWDEYNEFTVGGGIFDSYLLNDYKAIDFSTACGLLSAVYNDMFDPPMEIPHICENSTGVFYRQSNGFSIDCLATLPHAEYIIVRPIGDHGGESLSNPLLIKPTGRWCTTYELLMAFAESLMLRDSGFQDDFTHRAKQKFESVKEKFEQRSVGDSSGRCTVCGNIDFDSYAEHVASTQHLKNYRKELNKLFRPTLLETEAEKGLIKLDDSNGHFLAHRSPTCLEYIKHVSKHMELKNTALAQLSYLANCIATRENVDYTLACAAVTRSCYSMGLPLMLDAGDKPVRASSPTLKENRSVRAWLADVRRARADEFNEVDARNSNAESEERCAIEAQILYALAAMFEQVGCEPLSLLNADFPNILANENRPNRRHVIEIFISGDDVRSAYSSAHPSQRMGFCNFVSIFAPHLCEVSSSQSSSGLSTIVSKGQDRLYLSQSDITALVSELKDYEVGNYAPGGVMSRIARFTRLALEADPLFTTELVTRQDTAVSQAEDSTKDGSSATSTPFDPPEITLPNMRRSISVGGDELQQDLSFDRFTEDLNGDTSALSTDLQDYPIDIYQSLLTEVDRYLEPDDSEPLQLSNLQSVSFGGFNEAYSEECSYRDDLIFSNSFDTGSGIARDCYSMQMLQADINRRDYIDKALAGDFASQVSAIYSAVIPSHIGPRSYLHACSDLHTQVLDSLTAYNGVSSVDTADAVAIALNATRIVRQDVYDIASTRSVTYLPGSRTVLRKTAFGN